MGKPEARGRPRSTRATSRATRGRERCRRRSPELARREQPRRTDEAAAGEGHKPDKEPSRLPAALLESVVREAG